MLYVLVVVNADDWGRMVADPSTVRMTCWPSMEEGDQEVAAAMVALHRVGLIGLYRSEGRPYLQVIAWDQHQRLSRRAAAKLPEAQAYLPEFSTVEELDGGTDPFNLLGKSLQPKVVAVGPQESAAGRSGAQRPAAERGESSGDAAERSAPQESAPEQNRTEQKGTEQKEDTPPEAGVAAPLVILGGGGGGRKGRSRRMPHTFTLTDDLRAFALGRGLDAAAVDEEWEQFRDHEFRDPRSDWAAVWRTWVRNAVKFRERDAPTFRQGAPRTAGEQTMANIRAMLAEPEEEQA